MATTTPITDVEILERRRGRVRPPVRMAWGAIFAGTVAALGIWALLYALGLALGLSAVDPNNPDSAKVSGIFTGIWSLVVPLVALFIGGTVAGRGAGFVTRSGGAIHGLVMWGLTTLIGAWAVANLVGALLGGAAAIGRDGIHIGANAIGQLGQPQSFGRRGAFGLDADLALGPINDRLQAEGKQPITPEQLTGATRDVLSAATREGRLDRQTLVTAITQNTDLSQEDAEEVADRIDAQFQISLQRVQSGALQAADTSGKVFWGVFGALFLGLISAMLGAIAGVSRRQVELARISSEPAVVAHDVTGFPPAPLHP